MVSLIYHLTKWTTFQQNWLERLIFPINSWAFSKLWIQDARKRSGRT
jgi:hypothetical protein